MRTLSATEVAQIIFYVTISVFCIMSVVKIVLDILDDLNEN